MLELYQRCGFSLYSALFSPNKWDGDRERDRTRGKRGSENGWKREIELVLEPFVEANLERAAIILFFRREPAASHGNQIEYTNSRGLKCDLSQICGDLDGARARLNEQRLSPAEQSSRFLLDAQDNPDSAELPLPRSIEIGL